MTPDAFTSTGRRRQRGSVYLVVLGLSMLVTILALGAIAAGLAQRRAAESLNDAAEARAYAAAAIDMGRLAISQDSSWRTDHNTGSWITGVAIGSGTLSLSASDPIDGVLSNRPYDPLVLTGTGYKGRAIQMMQATLVPSPTPIDALKYAIFVPGMLHNMAAAQSIFPGGATVATNGTLQNEGTLLANAQCFLTGGPGTITGTTTLLSTSIATPPTNIESMYVALGTAITIPGNTLQNTVLGPGYNPYGTANADGLYVISSSADVTIKNCRIYGTLVVVAPNHNVIIDQAVNIAPSRTDYPALIIDGNAQFKYTSSGNTLSESSLNVNFNPPGAPYNGVTNATSTDMYPSMISGLVHVKGTIQITGAGLIHGAVICESTAAHDAVQVNADEEIDYDPTLYTSPPQGYTKSVSMLVQSGSVARSTN